MFGRSIAFLLVIMFAVSLCGQAGAVTNGTIDGTYDFGSLGAADSGGAGFKTQGDKFKVSNAFALGDNVYGALTSIYAGDANGLALGTTSTLIIKAEGGTTNKHFTLKDMNFDVSPGTGGFRDLDTFTITLKDSGGSTIATHSLASNVSIPEFLTVSKFMSTFPFSVPFPAAGYDYVSEITITWHFTTASNFAPAELNFNSITVANVSAIPLPTVTSNAASGITATGATLNGTVNANGNNTTVTFDYGTTTGYGSSATATQSPVTGSSNTAVSAAISGLTCGGTTYHFRVKGVNGGGTANGSDLTFTTGVCAPTVTGISPTSGPAVGGTAVTITGTNLTGATAVTIGGAAVTGVTVVNASTITATTPAGTAGVRDVVVATPGGTGTGTGLFTYIAAPTVTGISPASGPPAGGTSVVITGTNLTAATAVMFGATNATGYTGNSATQITATSPAGSVGTVDITVVTAGGASATSASDQFSYVTAPTVTTQAASAVVATSATGNGTITATGGANATARGVIYWGYNNSDQVIGDGGVTNVSENGSFGTGAFTASLTSLSVNTQYNARAYATSPNGTGYGARVAFWTLANVPAMPTVNTPTATTLNVAVNVNGNPSGTEFAIQETSTGYYVQADGTLNAGAVWQNGATWGTKTVTGLTTGSTYTFQVKARNGGSTETAYGATTSGVPSAAGVASPTINEDNDSGAIAITGITAYYKITGITGGMLYSDNGFTSQIPNGDFIATAGATTNVYFRPTANFNGSAGFSVQGSTTNNDGGLTGNTATSTITVNPVADTPSVASPTVNEDTDSGAISLTRNAADGAETTYYKITGITGGTLYSDAGFTSQIPNGTFIASGGATTSVYFRPTANRNSTTGGNGSFTVQASKSNSDAGLGGATATSTITLTPVADTPSVASPTINEDADSGAIAITRNAADGAETTYYKITGITGGTLYSNSGFTALITDGSFIASAGATTNVYFRPTANRNATTGGNGSFTVQASKSNADAGLGGSTATSTITLTPIADTPSITAATTTPATQTSSGLVISRNAADGPEVAYFKITNIANGTLYQNDGTTAIAANSFITYAQANAGLKFTPSGASDGAFNLQASTSNNDSGLGGSVVTATVSVGVGVASPTVNEDTDSGAIAISGNTAFYKITGITGGTLYSNAGFTTPINNGAFIATAGAATNVYFRPTANFNGNAGFSAQGSTSAADAGLTGNTAASVITVTAVNDAPTVNVPATITVIVDTASALTGISFGDVDAGSSSVTATLSVNSGTCAATSSGGVTVAGSGTATLTLTGSISNLNAFIAAGNVKFTTASHATADVTLTTGINDGGNTGIGGALTASGTTMLHVASAPTTTVSTAVLSADTGTSATDFVTKTAAQTISGTLSAALIAGESVQVSHNNGSTWANATTFAVGAAAWSTTTTLSGSSTFQARVTNAIGSSSAYNHTYTLDTTAPTTSISYSPAGPYSKGTTVTITANFSEPIADSPVTQIAVSAPTGGSALAATNMSKSTTTQYTYSYTVGNGNGTPAVTLSTGTDAAGNVVTATPTSGDSFTVNKSTSSTTLGSNATPSVYNDSVTFTATVTSGATGTVDFKDDGTSITGCAAVAISGTTATCTTSALTAGNHSITAQYGGDDTYDSSTSSIFTQAVDKATQTVAFADATVTKTYGNADFGPGATASSTLAVSYASNNDAVATITAGGLVHIVGWGNATITATQAGDANYLAASTQQTLTVNKATLTVTADNTSRACGAANPAFTAQYSGFVNGEDSSLLTGVPAFSTTADASSPVGSYVITPTVGTLAAASYDFTFAPGTLAVGLASQSITFNALPAKTYGDATFTIAATGGASANAVTFASSNTAVATVSDTTVTIVGAGSATITANQAGNSNYASATAQQTLTVNKATLTVTADSVSRAYNTVNPALTASYSGFVGSEGVSVLTGAPLLTTTATLASPAGSYPITAAIGTLAANNYTFSFANGTLAVGLLSQAITFDTLAAKIYGDTPFTLFASASSALGVTFASSNSAVATVSGTTVTIVGAGSATITASQAGDTNHAPATAQQILTVNKANLTVTTVNVSRAYNTANPTFTASYSEFVNGEDATALQGAPNLSTAADISSSVGSYPITAAVGNLFSNNYSFTYGAGTMTIDKATAGVSLGSLNATYDGTAKSVAATTTPAGLSVAVTYNGLPTAPTAAGSYNVSAVINDTNYSGTANGTLVIAYSATAPTLTISTLADNSVTNNTTLNVSGTAASINGIQSVTVNSTAVTLAGNGTFSQAVTLQPGKNTITVIATDNAGTTTTDSRTITLDTTAPVITITAPADNGTLAAASVTVTGTVDKSATVQATVNDGSAQSAAMDGTTFSVTLNLAEGTNTITISATDLAGNSASVKRTITSDTTKPTLAITDPAQDITTSEPTLTITGTVSDALTAVTVTITCDGKSYTPQVANGAFQQQITFATAKQYAITVTATDQAGNSVTTQRNVIHALSSLPSGDINNDGKVDIADALLALRVAVGIVTPNQVQLAAGDVAPLANGKPAPDGVIDIADAMLILEKAVGILTW